ncbi:hypothetical protein BD311DRAFT_768263 [Dichomitus squalens]|uniref:Uncharacterized protein n=1 Tax=Dichomitus squalens TaxID=114155 RepID=A0A4Q9MC25_9APHY|nr:hypothetical protein BD311DRAFT_768263 [Dichomitus squalens]
MEVSTNKRFGSRGSGSSLIAASGLPRPRELDDGSGRGRTPLGRETLRLGGVRFSGGGAMVGDSQSVKDSVGSNSSWICGEARERSMLVEGPRCSGYDALKGSFSSISTISGETKEAGEGGDCGLCRIPLAMVENFFCALATVPRFDWKTENMRGQRTGRTCGPVGKYKT